MKKGLLSGTSLTVAAYALLATLTPAFAQEEEATPTPAPTQTPAQIDESTESPVLTSEGISGDIDKKRRSPVVSVGTNYFSADSKEGKTGGARARILVDAFIPNPEYQKYPIRVDFYVNRTLFTSQIRSTELPGPLGIEVPTDKATVPFNYSIVATLLHPNREFTTVIHGAVFANPLHGTSKRCILTLDSGFSGATGAHTYAAEDVSLNQAGNEAITVSFESSKLEDGSGADTVSASSSLAVSGDTAKGTLTATINGKSSTKEVSGDVSTGNSGIGSLSVTSEDGSLTLDCE